MILGITGSSGAGKSTVCEILERKYSSQTINADKIAKQLSKQGTNYLKEMVMLHLWIYTMKDIYQRL